MARKKKKKKLKLDEFHFHEAADRAISVADIADKLLSNHPVIKRHPKLAKRLDKVIGQAWKLCNEVHKLTEEKFE